MPADSDSDSDSAFRDAVIATSLDGRILSWSRGAQALFGWREHEVICRPFDELVDPRHHSVVAQSVAEVVAGKCVRGAIVKQRRNDDAVLYCLQTMVPMRDATGRVSAVLRIVFDLYSVQEAERAVRRALAQVREVASGGEEPFGRGLIHDERERTRAEYLRAIAAEARRIGGLLDELVAATGHERPADLVTAAD
jgi:PAS domain S-box-containing protein